MTRQSRSRKGQTQIKQGRAHRHDPLFASSEPKTTLLVMIHKLLLRPQGISSSQKATPTGLYNSPFIHSFAVFLQFQLLPEVQKY